MSENNTNAPVATPLKKDEILQSVAWAAGITKEQAEKAIAAISNVVKAGLSDASGNPVPKATQKIEGLGTYRVVETAAREVQNPQVLSAQKAAAEGKDLTDKQKELLAKVESGEVQAKSMKEASLKIGFRPEKALKEWVAPNSDDSEEGE